MAQEAQGALGRAEPAEAEHHGFEVDAAVAGVAHREVEARGLALGVGAELQLEGPEALGAGAERPLGEDQGGDAAVVATLRAGRLGVAHAEAHGLDPAGGLVLGDDANAGHGRGV